MNTIITQKIAICIPYNKMSVTLSYNKNTMYESKPLATLSVIYHSLYLAELIKGYAHFVLFLLSKKNTMAHIKVNKNKNKKP